jgi:hypothetical protein
MTPIICGLIAGSLTGGILAMNGVSIDGIKSIITVGFCSVISYAAVFSFISIYSK